MITLEQALGEVVISQNKRRLYNIHKLKLENRVLSSRRKVCVKSLVEVNNTYLKRAVNVIIVSGDIGAVRVERQLTLHTLINKISKLSEQIGKNSNNILRLRTQIKQSKC